jgi:hypothetical protein
MFGEKTISVSFRVSPKYKQLLVLAAEREHRSQTNQLEMLLYNYCQEQGISVENTSSKVAA